MAQVSGAKVEDLKALIEGKEQKEASEAVYTTAKESIDSSLARLKKRNEDFLKRGERQKGEAVEKALRPLAEKLGLDSFRADEDGLSALTEAIEQGGQQTVDLSTLTPEQISELPAYKKALEATQQANSRADQLQSDFEAYKQQEQQQRTSSAWTSTVASILEQKNGIIGKSTYQKAAKSFINDVPASRRSIDADGNPVILDENGQPETDDHGRPLSFEAYVVKNYHLGFSVADPNATGSGAGAGQNGGAGGSEFTITSREQGEALITKYHESGDLKMKSQARKALSVYLVDNPDA